MNKSELITSVTRYVNLYFQDVSLNSDDKQFDDIFYKLVSENSEDEMLIEYWEEYEKLIGSALKKSKSKPKSLASTSSHSDYIAENTAGSETEETEIEIFFRGHKF